jgi:hypothetical protein
MTECLRPQNCFRYYRCFGKNQDAHCFRYFLTELPYKPVRKSENSELPDSSKTVKTAKHGAVVLLTVS